MLQEGRYRSGQGFDCVFVLFRFLSERTQRINLSTQILILTQLQTTRVAKQTASADYPAREHGYPLPGFILNLRVG